MKKVEPYYLNMPFGEIQEILMPYKSKIVGAEYSSIVSASVIFALIDTNRPPEIRRFVHYRTGQDLGPYANNLKHIASSCSTHIFEMDLPVTPK